ncbi:MAG: hypothetical protein JWM58_1656 [Rhizobium sp.]|nr:hypothetical protein [Rhizobium sp.]
MTEDDKPRRASLATDPVEHWCQHPGCKEWGGFGYDKAAVKRIGGAGSTGPDRDAA